MAYMNTTHATGSTLGFRAAAIFNTLATRYKQHRLFRATYNGLSALSNRDLADLGLHRSELYQVALESARNATK